MKTCFISNFPIDLIIHKSGVYQVACFASGWMTSLFDDVDEAIDFRATMDLSDLIAGASKEVRGGKTRLVNGKWMTKFLTDAELETFVPKVKQRRNVKDVKPDSGS